MSILAQPGTPQVSAIDAQRVEDTLSRIAPKWTTWVAQTLATQRDPMRVRDVAARVPFVSEQLVGKRLAQMHADGLVTRAEDLPGAPYRLSASGAALAPVHRRLAEWSQDYLPGRMAGAERVEDAVRRLYLRHSTAVIQTLGDGPLRFVELAEQAGLDHNHTHHRLIRLQLDGLVTRTGPHSRDPYVLTDAGAALGPVYAAVEHWSDPTAAARPAAGPGPRATRTRSAARPAPEGIRTAAALRRSPAAPGGLFSHAPQPQPRVPATITAQSSPSRSR
ncbi:winged helix-turn-helix transcriptional regulator [Streptomyces polygonati]|uniref:Winged helix-turn-helix transcriptional regulator n=1 Tax=Streptomyces polygonati TaxID=1617087 RepID=A0ABV8HZ87_9ACTN